MTSDSRVQIFLMSEVLAKKLTFAVITGNDFPTIPFLVQHTTRELLRLGAQVKKVGKPKGSQLKVQLKYAIW